MDGKTELAASSPATLHRRARGGLLLYLLRTVGRDQIIRHRGRSALCILGVALGTATVTAVTQLNGSIAAGFQNTVRAVAGSSDIELSAPVGHLSEDVLERVSKVPHVDTAQAVIESFLPLADFADQTIYLLGLDLLDREVWIDQIPEDGIVFENDSEFDFVHNPDSIALPEEFAHAHGLELGDTLRVVVPTGVVDLRMRAVVRNAPMTALFDGAVGFMDLPWAQKLLDREGKLDRIAVRSDKTAGIRDALAAAAGPNVLVEAAAARGTEVEDLLLTLRSMLAVSSSFALIVAAFLIHHAVVVSVEQRRREFALLNAVGIMPRTILELCLLETTVLGMVGAVIGWLLGLTLAAQGAGVVADATSDIWMPLHISTRGPQVHALTFGLVIALGTAIVVSYLAVHRTAQSPTVEALRPTGTADEGRLGSRASLSIALALFAGTWLILLLPPGLSLTVFVGTFVATQVMAYGACALAAPYLVVAFGRLLQASARHLPWVPLRLAFENLPRAPHRAGLTIATTAAAIGLAVSCAGLMGSFERAWNGWLDAHFTADLFVGAGTRFRLLAGPPISQASQERVAATEGVQSVEPMRVVPLEVDGRPAFLQGISLRHRREHGGLAMVEGDFETVARAMRDSTDVVLLSDNLSHHLQKGRGDTIRLPTPRGPRDFTIAGTFVDYLGSLDLGSVGVSTEALTSIWQDHDANLLRVWIRSGVDPSAVRERILQRLGGTGYYALTAGTFRSNVEHILNGFFRALWALEVVALLVGIVGILVSQLATVVDRRDELRTLRTIGLSPSTLARSVMVECGILGAAGAMVGTGLALVLLWQFFLGAFRNLTGWQLPYTPPGAFISVTVVLAMVVSAVAGYLPGLAASRTATAHQSRD